MKNFFTIRKILTFFLFISIAFASFSAYYKIRYWGFGLNQDTPSDVWNVDAHISFTPTGEPINISLSTPNTGSEFKIDNEIYTILKEKDILAIVEK